jgi:hypothetical protein
MNLWKSLISECTLYEFGAWRCYLYLSLRVCLSIVEASIREFNQISLLYLTISAKGVLHRLQSEIFHAFVDLYLHSNSEPTRIEISGEIHRLYFLFLGIVLFHGLILFHLNIFLHCLQLPCLCLIFECLNFSL